MANELSNKSEQQLINSLFFCFGFAIMAWIPRFPEVKANLALNNGAFGSLISAGAIGAFLGLLTVGHIIHKYGALKVSLTAIGILFTSLAVLVHIRSSFLFLILNIAFAFGITAVHVCLNSHLFHFLERSEKNLVITSSGYWSAGSLSTAIVSGLLVGRVGLVAHINVLCIVLVAVMVVMILKLRPHLLSPNEDSEHDYSVKDIFTSFKIDWPVSIGMACAIYLEFALGDWGTIFTKERLDVSGSLSATPFIVFTAMMIVGRLSINKLLVRSRIHILVKRALILAGVGFGLCIIIATHLPAAQKWWAYALFILGFAIAGLGSSFTAPAFFAAANRRSSLPSAVVVGQFGVVNTILTFGVKLVVAWTMQFTGSIALALMIPAAMMIAAVLFTGVLKEDSKSKN
ncbi:MAG: MFS transporter [Actinobacteria bacterium]|nr:MFS transporter [Actinomycetota bacterium]